MYTVPLLFDFIEKNKNGVPCVKLNHELHRSTRGDTQSSHNTFRQIYFPCIHIGIGCTARAALASLTVPRAGQELILSPNFDQLSWFSPIFANFLPHFAPPNGLVTHLERPWLRQCARQNSYYAAVIIVTTQWLDSDSTVVTVFNYRQHGLSCQWYIM